MRKHEFESDMSTFAHALRQAMSGKVGAQKLSTLTGIPTGTIESWLRGQVKRPRDWRLLLNIAQVLLLNRDQTDALLLAARHPTLDELDAQITPAHPERRYLQPWMTAAPALPSARHQLRAAVGDFVGRTGNIVTLRAALLEVAEIGSAAPITGVQGMGGIGKTELAYKVAQEVRYTFPDGQIVLALGGSSATPLSPEQALQAVLRAFIPEIKLPDDLPTLEALYRSQLDGRRVLILADDAASAAQVEPLLPPPGSALLVTSRLRLTLPAMTTIDLEQFPPTEASHLLRAICTRLTKDQAALLAQACGYLPLALRVSGSLLRSIPALAVDSYLAGLADERQRLSLLREPHEPQRDVEAVLALSYVQLDPTTQAVFRQLGVFVADFTTELAQAVAVLPGAGDVTPRLYQLQRRNLVMYEAQRERWRLHDLLHDLARHQLEASGEAEATIWRYARAAIALAQKIQEDYLAGGEKTLVALSQFDAERAHIDAARHWAQLHVQTPAGDQLLVDTARATLFIGSIRYDRRHQHLPLWESVRTAARRLGDRLQEGRALGNLGIVYAQLGETHTAISYYEQQLAIVRELGDRTGEGSALNNLASTYRDLGQPSKAVNCYKQALAIARELGHRYGECLTLGNLGLAYTDVGDTRRGIEYCRISLAMARESGNRWLEGQALSYLVHAQALQGDTARACNSYLKACSLYQEIGDRRGAMECNWLFGLALAQQGEIAQALPLLRVALSYEEEIGHAKAADHAGLVARLETGADLAAEVLHQATRVGHHEGAP